MCNKRIIVRGREYVPIEDDFLWWSMHYEYTRKYRKFVKENLKNANKELVLPGQINMFG